MSFVLKLTKKRLDKLSDISSDIALVALASIVLPAVLDKFNLINVLLGLLIAIVLWIFSLWLKK